MFEYKRKVQDFPGHLKTYFYFPSKYNSGFMQSHVLSTQRLNFKFVKKKNQKPSSSSLLTLYSYFNLLTYPNLLQFLNSTSY